MDGGIWVIVVLLGAQALLSCIDLFVKLAESIRLNPDRILFRANHLPENDNARKVEQILSCANDYSKKRRKEADESYVRKKDDIISDAMKYSAEVRKEADKKAKQIREGAEQQANVILSKANSEREASEKIKYNVVKLLDETTQSHPWLVSELSDITYAADMQISEYLNAKHPPAPKAADEVRAIAAEKRELQKLCKTYEYQLSFLESTIPWLKDFESVPVAEALAYTNDTDDDYDNVREWLSPEEYAKLGTSEKNQLALDRWRKRNKSDWQAGRDYERYIGYLYESKGFRVEYVGATMGKADRGIDLIARKGNDVDVIQCKRYSLIREHYVRENAIAQIFGVAALYNMENPDKHARAVIYTSSVLSDEARHFAEYLGVAVVDNYPLDDDYPIIKCNIGKDGEKIYHLPFDQQYDRIKVTDRKYVLYVATVSDAEAAGYRRAKKWVST